MVRSNWFGNSTSNVFVALSPLLKRDIAGMNVKCFVTARFLVLERVTVGRRRSGFVIPPARRTPLRTRSCFKSSKADALYVEPNENLSLITTTTLALYVGCCVTHAMLGLDASLTMSTYYVVR